MILFWKFGNKEITVDRMCNKSLLILQAVIQTPFNGGSPTSDGQTDGRFYFSTSVAGAGDVATAQPEAAVALAGQAGM